MAATKKQKVALVQLATPDGRVLTEGFKGARIFKEAIEQLPPAWPREATPREFRLDPGGVRGIPWGIPEAVWVAEVDRPALGIPPTSRVREVIGQVFPVLLVTRTKKLGELPMPVRIESKEGMPPGKMAFLSSRAHRTRHGLGKMVFFRWRCAAHEDCLENPELGEVCLRQRGGYGFAPPKART